MTLNKLSKWSVSLPLLSTVTEVSQSTVRQSVLAIVRKQVEFSNNPYEQARWSDVHNPDGVYDLPQPKTDEEMESKSNMEALTDWIMQTDEMQEAIMLFRGTDPHRGNPQNGEKSEALDEEQSEEISVEELLNGITPLESDQR